MSRSIQLQVLRGTFAQLQTLQTGTDPDSGQATNPLQQGELYFATDSQALYMGMPGVGSGLIQIGDMSDVSDKLDQLIAVMVATKRAIVAMACEDKKNNPRDFDVDWKTDNSVASE